MLNININEQPVSQENKGVKISTLDYSECIQNKEQSNSAKVNPKEWTTPAEIKIITKEI